MCGTPLIAAADSRGSVQGAKGIESETCLAVLTNRAIGDTNACRLGRGAVADRGAQAVAESRMLRVFRMFCLVHLAAPGSSTT